MATVEVKVPDIGEFADVPVIEVFVKPGDMVNVEDSLATLESDKATMDVPAPAAGVVKEVHVKVGDKVSEGTLLLVLDAAEAAAARPPRPAKRLAARRPRPGSRRRRPGGCRAPPPPRLRPTPARPTSSATCWCWAPARAATAPRSAPPTLA